MDDQSLSRLVSEASSRSILLLEDIDCAFPSREDNDDDEDQPVDKYGNPTHTGYQTRSEVTLSGLLNVLDSVTSEEGRITFATVCNNSLHSLTLTYATFAHRLTISRGLTQR